MERCTVRQGRTLRENPTVSSGDPSCFDSWMAAVETKSSSSWKWCLRTLSILSQVYYVISAHMYNMCTMEFLVWIKKKLYYMFFRVESIFTKLSFTEIDEFFKEFYKVDIPIHDLYFMFFYRWCFGYGMENRKGTGSVKNDSIEKNDRVNKLFYCYMYTHEYFNINWFVLFYPFSTI